MISGLRGQLVSKLPGILQVDVGGIIFRVLTSQHSVELAGDVGEQISLLTFLHVREDQLTLFGFLDMDELQCFELLLGVSGVGPRVALGVLSAARPDELYSASADEDTTGRTRMPGIGKKTAGRMILQLSGKLPEPTTVDAGTARVSVRSEDLEALDALQALGYSAAEARDALSRIEQREHQTVEE